MPAKAHREVVDAHARKEGELAPIFARMPSETEAHHAVIARITVVGEMYLFQQQQRLPGSREPPETDGGVDCARDDLTLPEGYVDAA